MQSGFQLPVGQKDNKSILNASLVPRLCRRMLVHSLGICACLELLINTCNFAYLLYIQYSKDAFLQLTTSRQYGSTLRKKELGIRCYS